MNDPQHVSVTLLLQAVASFDIAHVIDLKILKSILKEVEVERSYDKLSQAERVFDRLNSDLKRDIRRRALELAEDTVSSRPGRAGRSAMSMLRQAPTETIRTPGMARPPAGTVRPPAGTVRPAGSASNKAPGKGNTPFLAALNRR